VEVLIRDFIPHSRSSSFIVVHRRSTIHDGPIGNKDFFGYRRWAMSRQATTTDDELAAMAKAIGHPARVQILRMLVARDTCATSEVVDGLPLAQSTVSEHLRILREAGLVQGEIDGPRTRYCVDPKGLAALKAAISSL
jgi:ArsR family transcriptional regulator